MTSYRLGNSYHVFGIPSGSIYEDIKAYCANHVSSEVVDKTYEIFIEKLDENLENFTFGKVYRIGNEFYVNLDSDSDEDEDKADYYDVCNMIYDIFRYSEALRAAEDLLGNVSCD